VYGELRAVDGSCPLEYPMHDVVQSHDNCYYYAGELEDGDFVPGAGHAG
jgi:hypothetical protein